MRADWSRLRALVLCPAACWCALGSVFTAFGLTVSGWPALLLLTVLWTGSCVFALQRRGGRLITLVLSVLALALTALLTEQLTGYLGAAARAYEARYGLAVPGILSAQPRDLTLAAIVLGAFLIRIGVGALLKGRSTSFLLLLAAVSAAYLPVPDAVPAALPFGGLLVCGLLLMMTSGTRDPRDAGRISAFSALPVLLAVLILFQAVPQDSYVNRAQNLREALAEVTTQWLQMLNLLPEGAAARVDLKNLGNFDGGQEETARLSSDLTCAVYLRERDYDRYTGNSWEATRNRTETLSGMGSVEATVAVSWPKERDTLLLPSFPAGEIIFTDGSVENTQGQSVYRYSLRSTIIGGQPGVQWLELPAASFEELRNFALSVIPEGADAAQAAGAVAEYVKSCAGYSHTPARMNGGEDFALWFLMEGESGYCTHFATVAAVLLRAYGVPARFVTGYRAEVRAGETVTVTKENAHAWVEYYDYRTWTWSVLEVTPGFDKPMEIPKETEPPTQPTEPTQPTRPTEPTQPTQPSTPPEPPKEEPSLLPGWLWYIPAVLLLLLLPELQRAVRRALRSRRRSSGEVPARAAALWRETALLSRLLKKEPPQVLRELAEKGAWSRDSLSPQELRRMEAGCAALVRLLKKRPWYCRLLYRYVYAVL